MLWTVWENLVPGIDVKDGMAEENYEENGSICDNKSTEE